MDSDAPHISPDLVRLKKTLGAEQCSKLLGLLRQRLESGEALDGFATLTDATQVERAFIAALLGGAVSRGKTFRVNLHKLEVCLREGELCGSLKQAVEALCGPVVNRRAERQAQQQGWDSLFLSTRHQIAGKPELLLWLEEVRTLGLLRRLAGNDLRAAECLMQAAVAVLLRLPVADVPLPRFAVDVLGDTHGLDPGRALTGLVLRAAARTAGLSRWDDAENRREVWAAVGVIADELSAPVLVLNLPALPSGVAGKQLRLLAETGEPTHLTVRQLLRDPPQFESGRGGTVFVCENPTVVVAAADELGASCKPLVCIQGQLKTSGRLLLQRLSEVGWELAYHGDFDWAGIQIANRLIERLHARPWRMSATDYRSVAPSSESLSGFEVAPRWDPELAREMKAVGFGVMEEQVLGQLCQDLGRPSK